jgi:hypothetical protein
VTFEPSPDLTLGSVRREKEARRRVARLLRRARPLQLLDGKTKTCAILASESTEALSKLLSDIDRALDAFRQESLHPREVEEILVITSRERVRWTKDGRLPRAGSGSFGRGRQTVQFALYPPKRIAALSREPQTIRAWREADAAPQDADDR